MSAAALEHVNVTTSSAKETADLLCSVFGWRVRWQGPAKSGGRSIHVGTEGAYVALYTPPADALSSPGEGQPNHVGLLVDDLEAIELKVIAAGYTPFNHGNYEPGRRFYFHDRGGVEFEVVSYA